MMLYVFIFWVLICIVMTSVTANAEKIIAKDLIQHFYLWLTAPGAFIIMGGHVLLDDYTAFKGFCNDFYQSLFNINEEDL